MKADWDDAPQHLKHKRQSAEKWWVAVSIGIAIIALVVYVGDHKHSLIPELPIAQISATESYTSKYEFN